MHSFRRAILRSAISAGRNTVASSRATLIPRSSSTTLQRQSRASPLDLRCFSVTKSAAAAGEAMESATAAAEENVNPDKLVAEETVTPGEIVAAQAVAAEAVDTEVNTAVKDTAASPVAEAAQGQDAPATAPTTTNPNSRSDRANETAHGLFIRNMVFEATEEHLNEAFSKYGTVTKSIIARDGRGLSRGYGFVWFSSASDLAEAIAGTDGSFWHGRRVQVAPRESRRTDRRPVQEASGPSKCLFIGNIPYETTDAELNKLFRSMDGVRDVRVAVDRTTGWPRGFAHVDFYEVDQATKAMAALQGSTIEGRSLRFDYAVEASTRSNDRQSLGSTSTAY